MHPQTHVCILQTTIDLLNQGSNVYIVVDGVSSQRTGDRSIALQVSVRVWLPCSHSPTLTDLLLPQQRLQHMGAILTTAESVLFELIGSAEHPHFKSLSKLVVAHARTSTNSLSCL